MIDVENKSLEEKAYKIVDKYDEFLPIENDKNRLGFCIYKNLIGEGDEPEVIVKSNKLTLRGISEQELASKLKEDLAN